jgi:hypothetical protein
LNAFVTQQIPLRDQIWHFAINATGVIAPFYFVTALSEQYANEIFGDVLRNNQI